MPVYNSFGGKDDRRDFSIERFSLHDGPGIRTSIFLKGCSLHCIWCHNPESHEKGPVLQYLEKECAGCFACVSACPVNAHCFVKGRHLIDRKNVRAAERVVWFAREMH